MHLDIGLVLMPWFSRLVRQGLETDRVHSYNPGARTGRSVSVPMTSSDLEKRNMNGSLFRRISALTLVLFHLE